MAYKMVAVGLVLAGTALGSAALTLGQAVGEVSIGQALELQIPVQLDASQSSPALCPEVDIYQGDIRQDSKHIQIQSAATAEPHTVHLKVHSSVLVDEPVVTVYLRVGCDQKTTRTYVLLADFPQDIPAPPISLSAASALTAEDGGKTEVPWADAGGVPKAASGASSKQAMTSKTSRVQARSSKPASAKNHAGRASVEALKPHPAPLAKTAFKPHLQLALVETMAERVSKPEASTTQGDGQEALAHDDQRIAQLEGELRGLHEQASRQEAGLASLRQELKKTQAERVPVAVVYALLALLGICLTGLAYVWKRKAQPRRWTDQSPGLDATSYQSPGTLPAT